ncbi:MAG: transglycosylase SLT domain-containing protein [Chitinophagales bacterium]
MYKMIRLDKTNEIVLDLRSVGVLVLLLLISNFVTYSFWGNTSTSIESSPNNLYLLQEASVFVSDVPEFEQKVKIVSNQLDIPPEWLMAVMYSESKFDASVKNYKGSGAIGLIQWMPKTAKDLGVTVERLQKMSHVEQLDFVYTYLNRVRERYGSFNSLTDLYLGILYPKSIEGDFCYTLYANPSQAYKQNSGLDEDDDGRVTVRDIDKRMKRIYPTAYMIAKN